MSSTTTTTSTTFPWQRNSQWSQKTSKGVINGTCAGISCLLLLIYTMANIFLVFYETNNLVVLHPNGNPGVQQNAVYYYNYIDTSQSPAVTFLNSSNIAVATYLSGANLALYGEDLLRF